MVSSRVKAVSGVAAVEGGVSGISIICGKNMVLVAKVGKVSKAEKRVS